MKHSEVLFSQLVVWRGIVQLVLPSPTAWVWPADETASLKPCSVVEMFGIRMLNSCLHYEGTGKWSSCCLSDWMQIFLIKDQIHKVMVTLSLQCGVFWKEYLSGCKIWSLSGDLTSYFHLVLQAVFQSTGSFVTHVSFLSFFPCPLSLSHFLSSAEVVRMNQNQSNQSLERCRFVLSLPWRISIQTC